MMTLLFLLAVWRYLSGPRPAVPAAASRRGRRPPPPRQHAQRAREDARVERERAVLDVVDVELDPLRPRQRGAAVDLRPAGQAGPDRQPPALALAVLGDLRGHGRARADQRHLAAQHVPEVRQLVERGAPQQRADARDARRRRRRRRGRRRSARRRRPSCAACSTSNSRSVAPDAALAVDRRPGALEADRDRRRPPAAARSAPARARRPTTSTARRITASPPGASQPAGVPWRR